MKELTARSDRVKSVDIHPSEVDIILQHLYKQLQPWVLSALYNGNVFLWDYTTNTLVKSFEFCEVPVRCAKFIVRKQWIIGASDDMHLRVYNYNTMEKVKEWEAHTDYIRYLEVHSNRSVVLSSSDDMTIKLWDWDKEFECIQTYEGHAHYVMMVKINPRDTNTFASASLDRTIKVWGLTAGTAHFSLEGSGGHDRGVNCIDYYPGGDKPYLLSGSDDKTVKIWDYQTKACLQTLEGHSQNVSAVCFHPRLPLIVTGAEDGTVRLWHSTTYRPETTLNYGMERVWALAPTKDANKLAIGYDEGTIVIKLGNERPVASLDVGTGKLVWAKGHDIQTMSVKGLSRSEISDGEKIQLSARDLGACEVYPQMLQHNRNGQFIVVCGHGEYIIYTSQALRNKAFGTALDFVWSSQGTGDYAVRESISRVKIYKNFNEHRVVKIATSSAEGLFGGVCLAVRGPEAVTFHDWEEGILLRKIDVVPRNIYWNDSGDCVVLACDEVYYVLRYAADSVATALASGQVDEDGVDGAFELQHTMNDKVRTGQWVGDCFLFTNGSGRLNYYVGGEVVTLSHLDHSMYLLGFVPKEDRVFLIDKAYNVTSHRVLLSVLNYQTAVVREDFDSANALLPQIPKSEHTGVARFLESQGYKEEALAVTTDDDHRFELALDLHKLQLAHEVLQETEGVPQQFGDSTEVQSKWRRLGDLALAQGNIPLAQSCAERSSDLSGLLLLYSTSGNKEGIIKLAKQAHAFGRSNVAFMAHFITGQIEECIALLVDTGRIPEAAFMARTYMPSMTSSILSLWKSDLKSVNERAAEALADPEKYPNLFPDFAYALQVEDMFRGARNIAVPASSYPVAKGDLDLNLIEIVKARALQARDSQSEIITPSNDDDHDEAISQNHSSNLSDASQSEMISTIAETTVPDLVDENGKPPTDKQIPEASACEVVNEDDLECLEAQMEDLLEVSTAEDGKNAVLDDDLNLDEEDW